jgi:molybdate transport system substrate-binding protein
MLERLSSGWHAICDIPRIMASKLLFLLCALGVSVPLHAGEIHLAVASNFFGPVREIASAFERATGDKVTISSGSTGKLYAQILNGAPFDLFLAANSREPERLEKAGLIRPGSRYTYARGVLALWAPGAGAEHATDPRALLAADAGGRLSIANPATAPYGAAAEAVLNAWKLTDAYKGRIIRGENIAQAYQFAATGNARFGFVALSQLLDPARPPSGTYWRIDGELYPPIRQQVVMLARAADSREARAFWAYLKSGPARARIAAFGYGLE